MQSLTFWWLQPNAVYKIAILVLVILLVSAFIHSVFRRD